MAANTVKIYFLFLHLSILCLGNGYKYISRLAIYLNEWQLRSYDTLVIEFQIFSRIRIKIIIISNYQHLILMENNTKYIISLISLFVVVMTTGFGNIVYADSPKTQKLQMHLNLVMDELNNNNTEGAKKHLQSAQIMVSSMNEQNATSIANNHSASQSIQIQI